MRDRTSRTLVLTSLLLLSTGGMHAAIAAPIYTVTDRVNTTSNTDQSATPGLTTSGSWFLQSPVFPGRIFSGDYFAQANQGTLGASLNASQTWVAGANSEAGAAATLRYDDIVFSSGDGSPIDVTLPLHLSGALTTSVVSTRLIVEADLAGQDRTGTYNPAVSQASGMLSGLSGGVIDTTLFVSYTNVPTNTPVSLFLSIALDVFINGNNTTFADFGSTYGLVSGGPVFLVPEGIDVDSEQAGIVGNQLLVPEPKLAALLLLALALLARVRVPWR